MNHRDTMNTEKVSDTPRTDAEQEHVNNAFNDQVCTVPAPDPCFVPVGFARQLERELAEWKACADKLVKYLYDTSSVGEFDRCRAVKNYRKLQLAARSTYPMPKDGQKSSS